MGPSCFFPEKNNALTFDALQDCDNLCYGVHTEQCATPELLNVATGKDSGASGGFGGHSTALFLMSAVAALLVGRPL